MIVQSKVVENLDQLRRVGHGNIVVELPEVGFHRGVKSDESCWSRLWRDVGMAIDLMPHATIVVEPQRAVPISP